MRLEGSCHCGAVTFAVEADAPVPYLRCYCSVCRKTAGTGGFAVNLGGRADSLVVSGDDSAVGVYRAVIDGVQSPAERRFCTRCGTALWLWDPRWPELVHPHAGAIDTPLPEPPEAVHMMTGPSSRPAWVRVDARPGEAVFDGYPDRSLAAWHAAHGLTGGGGGA